MTRSIPGVDLDALVVLLMYELHSHVPEEQRPMSMSDLSDEQAERARRAVNTVLVRSLLSKPVSRVSSLAEIDGGKPPSSDVLERLRARGKIPGVAVARRLLCLAVGHVPSEARSMGTSIERKRRGRLLFFAYDRTCPRCQRTYREWR